MSSMAATASRIPTLLLLVLLLITAVEAQSPSNQISETLKPSAQVSRYRPAMAAIIATIISFLILLVMYTYNRINPTNQSNSAAASNSVRQKAGLDPSVLNSFPTMLYSDVKEHKIGKSPLECAVCINEFEDQDSLRLLPKCSHVFHEECIDAWLASHFTCPVCRDDLQKGENMAADETVEEQVAVVVVVVEDEEEERRRERKDLARLASRSKRGGARRQRKLMRSYTTGHIAADLERYTLRLPESVKKEIIVARRLRRERSLPVSGVKGEGYAGSSGRRSLKNGLPAKWPSFFIRSRSGKGFPMTDKLLKASP